MPYGLTLEWIKRTGVTALGEYAQRGLLAIWYIMFESLTDKISGIFSKLRGKGSLSENDVMAVSREIRVALLEADVALPVVKDFIEGLKSKAVGQAVIKGVNPGQQVIKIVNDALIEMLGGKSEADRAAQELKFGAPPSVILMVGLQGSGKTTTTAKVAKFLTDKRNKKVLMASLDVYRPAAQEQLAQLSGQTGVSSLAIVADQKPLDITARALDTARKEGYDVVILDTAGRTTLDETMMAEVKAIQKASNPAETLLVADAMTGQDAVNTAKAFDDAVGVTGIVLTRMDGDARGGAALSMKAVTGRPVKLVGVGEKWDALEPFYAERAAGRILGMGDVVSLVEKAIENVDRGEAEQMAAKLKQGKFDFNDLLMQMRQMNKMGGMGAMMKMLPGMGNMSGMLEKSGFDERTLKWQEAIILSMTPAERGNPDLLNASRKRRIAAGAGRDVQEINRLVKQQKQMETVMKRIKKMGMGGMMKQMKAMMGGKMDEMEMLAGSMGADDLAAGLSDSNNSPLGPNPFAGGGLPSLGGGNPFGSFLGQGGGFKKGKRK